MMIEVRGGAAYNDRDYDYVLYVDSTLGEEWPWIITYDDTSYLVQIYEIVEEEDVYYQPKEIVKWNRPSRSRCSTSRAA